METNEQTGSNLVTSLCECHHYNRICHSECILVVQLHLLLSPLDPSKLSAAARAMITTLDSSTAEHQRVDRQTAKLVHESTAEPPATEHVENGVAGDDGQLKQAADVKHQYRRASTPSDQPAEGPEGLSISGEQLHGGHKLRPAVGASKPIAGMTKFKLDLSKLPAKSASDAAPRAVAQRKVIRELFTPVRSFLY